MANDLRVMLAEVIRRWQLAGATPRPGNGRRELANFEKRYGVRLPPDVSDFFLAADGMADGESDEHGIRFWPLSEVKPVTIELPDLDRSAHEGYFVFADYSMWAHGYAIRLTGNHDHDVVIVGGDAPIYVASSLTDFLARYLKEPLSLFGSS